jgi:Flp pilus assembly protein TadD
MRQAMVAAALALITIITYWPATSNDFVGYDDPEYVTTNRVVQEGLSWFTVRWAFTTTAVGNWHPLAWLSHMLDSELYGMEPRGHHLTNVILHTVAAVALLLALTTMTGALWRSSLVAALFALHPQHVQSVAWVAERKDVLSALLAFLTLLAYGWYVQRRGAARYILVIACFALGLLAKPMLVTLPVLLLLLDVWPLRRFRILDSEFWRVRRSQPGGTRMNVSVSKSKIQNPISLVGLVIEKLPLFILAVASCLITIIAQNRGGMIGTLEVVPAGARLSNAVVAYAWYVWKAIWPANLAVFHPHPGHWPVLTVVASSLALVAMTAMSCLLARRRPAVIIGWLWFVVALLPVIGLVQVGSQAFADRYSYIPHVGLFMMLAFGVPKLSGRGAIVAGVVGSAALVAFLMATRSELRHWKNSAALFERALAVTDDNWLARVNLGNEYSRRSDHRAAMEQYTRALALRPDLPEAHYGMGQALAFLGQLEEAKPHWRRAIDSRPDYSQARYSLAQALIVQDRMNEGLAELDELLRLNPNFADAHLLLGIIRLEQGRLEEAIKHLSRAAEIDPGNEHVQRELQRARETRDHFPPL